MADQPPATMSTPFEAAKSIITDKKLLTNAPGSTYTPPPQTAKVNVPPTASVSGAVTGTSVATAQDYLNQYQQQAKDIVAKSSGVGSAAGASDQTTLANVRAALTPTTPFPTAPNLTQEYTEFRASMGVNDLENNLTSLNSQIATIQSSLEAQKTAEEATGGTVPLSVIAGRQTEEQRQAQVKLDSLSLQKGVLVDELNTKYNAINTYMQLSGQDYQNARTQWTDEFNLNSKIYDAVISQQQYANTLAMEQQKVAMTNAQTMANLLIAGNLNANDLVGPDGKPTENGLYMTKLATTAGLPSNFFTLIHSTYAPGVTTQDISKAEAAPKKITQPGWGKVPLFNIPLGQKDQWIIYNPLTHSPETFDTTDAAIAAQQNYLAQAREGVGATTTTPSNISPDGQSYWDATSSTWIPVVP